MASLVAPFPKQRQFIMPSDYEHGIGDSIAALQWTVNADNVQNQASIANLIPLYITEYQSSVSFFIVNGATIAGNIDLGLYDSAFGKIVTTGSTAQAGVSIPQSIALVTKLRPGRYYWAWSSNSATASFQSLGTSSSLARAAGCLQMAAAFPLPTTITPAALADGVVYHLPLGGISMRTLV
jgi:hypothetical protein